MLSYIHYISASRRLEEYNKTIKLMGGQDAPNQLLAQRDMIKLEVDYYADRCAMWNFILGMVFIFGIFGYVVLFKIGVIG